MKQFIKKILGKKLSSALSHKYTEHLLRFGLRSYSQEGEDRVLYSILCKLNHGRLENNGFYVDVGAHHPFRFSNTYLYYRLGWRGINIDAMPGSMSLFQKKRPRDINLEIGIGKIKSKLNFYIFNESALNTFDELLAKSRINEIWKIVEIVQVPVLRLADVLKEKIPDHQPITFFSIDVEGFDLDVLKSNDWQYFRPKVILTEHLERTMRELMDSELTLYLEDLGYILFSKTVNTCFFVDQTYLDMVKKHE